MLRPRAVWIEADDALPRPLPLPPTMTVETSPGRRHYIYVCSDLDWQDWHGVQRLLIAKYGSDPGAGMRTQVLRLPGTLHLKNPNRPHLVRFVEEMTTERTYTAAEITAAFPPKSPPPRRQQARKGVEKPADCYPPDILAALQAIDARLQSSESLIARGDHPDDQPIHVDWSRHDWWLRATACLHHASGGSEAGFALSCAASGGDSAFGLVGCPAKFDIADQRRLWDSLSADDIPELPRGSVTIRTIFWIAQRYCGWKSGRRGRPHGQPRPMNEIPAKSHAVAEAGRRAIDIGLDKMRSAHAAWAAQRVRPASMKDRILTEIRKGLNPRTGFMGISSLTGFALTLGCSPDTLRRHLRRLARSGLIVKNDGNATSVLGISGITVALNLPDALFDAFRDPLNAASENPPIIEQTGIEIPPFSNRPGYNPARCATSHGHSTESGCFNAGKLSASNGRGCRTTAITLSYSNDAVVIPCEYSNDFEPTLADLRGGAGSTDTVARSRLLARADNTLLTQASPARAVGEDSKIIACATAPHFDVIIRDEKANPSRTRIRQAFDPKRVDRTNNFLASVVARKFDWIPAAQATNDYRADLLWQLLPGRQPADLITPWLSSGLLPDDACQKINERIAKSLGAHRDRGVSLATLHRDIDALTDALTKLFEETQGDRDLLHVAIAAAIKDCAGRHAYRLRRFKGDKADEVDLPDIAMLPPSQFVSDLIEKLHRQIDILTQQPWGSSFNEAAARLGRRSFTRPAAMGAQQL
jgi:hypothetical protein